MVLEIRNLVKNYEIPRNFRSSLRLQALRGISLTVGKGETLAVVGESGCGKSTLAKVLMKLEPFEGGSVQVLEKNLQELSSSEISENMQMIFQDPSSSLNRRKKVRDIIAEPLRVRGTVTPAELQKRVFQVAQACGVPEDFLERYPHMMSGGQRQRVGIARALITEPEILILDEPVSALDVSVQAQILNLLMDIREQRKISYIFISHDLSVVRWIAHSIAVLYLGEVVELGSASDLFQKPLHPYTQLLLASAPSISSDKPVEIPFSELPSPLNPPPGCSFAGRCPHVQVRCREEPPPLRNIDGRSAACHFAENWA